MTTLVDRLMQRVPAGLAIVAAGWLTALALTAIATIVMLVAGMRPQDHMQMHLVLTGIAVAVGHALSMPALLGQLHHGLGARDSLRASRRQLVGNAALAAPVGVIVTLVAPRIPQVWGTVAESTAWSALVAMPFVIVCTLLWSFRAVFGDSMRDGWAGVRDLLRFDALQVLLVSVPLYLAIWVGVWSLLTPVVSGGIAGIVTTTAWGVAMYGCWAWLTGNVPLEGDVDAEIAMTELVEVHMAGLEPVVAHPQHAGVGGPVLEQPVPANVIAFPGVSGSVTFDHSTGVPVIEGGPLARLPIRLGGPGASTGAWLAIGADDTITCTLRTPGMGGDVDLFVWSEPRGWLPMDLVWRDDHTVIGHLHPGAEHCFVSCQRRFGHREVDGVLWLATATGAAGGAMEMPADRYETSWGDGSSGAGSWSDSIAA